MNLQLLWTGGSIAYWSSILTPIMALQLKSDPNNADMKDNMIDSYALLGMVAFGFGEVIGGGLNGLVLDKIGS